jgi:pimeloyl-ACP methyl ester carboxylesterase
MTFPIKSLLSILTAIIGIGLSQSPLAADELIRLESRPDVIVPVYYMKRDGATATVVLLPGGMGGIGKLEEGKPTGTNFLVRTREFFADAGLNVAVMHRASDKTDLDYPDRVSDEHMTDIRTLIDYLKKDAGVPVWLVGNSRGTVSATAAAVRFGNAVLGGIVLTSSVVNYKKVGAVPSQDLGSIKIPTLVVHHEQDGCIHCRPHEVPAIVNGLKNAPFKKLMMVNRGGNPSGDPCGAMHYHGFIGMEKEAVAMITEWIKKPLN